MKLIQNTGADRVIDLVRPHLVDGNVLDCVTPCLSLFAFAELREALLGVGGVHLILPPGDDGLQFLGGAGDRAARNRLQARWLANECAKWIREKVEVRRASGQVPQGAAVMRKPDGAPEQVVLGSFAFSTDGLGLTPGNPLSLIQASESADEATQLAKWLDHQWAALGTQPNGRDALIQALCSMGEHRAPFALYTLILHHLFLDRGDDLDEERIVNSATGIRNTVVWKKLYKFQRDGVVGAIDKLDRFGGCIIADSVGLGKTFEALAIIKYHELRNNRVLVLVPKRLRDNWTLYKANDRRNFLAPDRFNYDVLNHTDLSRDGGLSGDIDLAHVNWGNYDLVVIDESHNFRNKKTPRVGSETRYDRLMRKIIKEGVKTRVLMLSATPVNNRLADLRNQIAFVTEGDDTALLDHGIGSIDSTTRLAQKQFNRWLDLEDADRTPSRLIEMLGFDYFTLLDLLTIARSRKHIQKYYGTAETGRFPDRLKPINIKADVDRAGEFRSIREINNEIRRLNLASYAPLRYVLPHKQEAYDKKYSTEVKGGTGFFRQSDREESLIHLLRINVLKRMESAVPSFALTVQRQLHDVEATLARIESHAEEMEEIEIEDVDLDDPAFESLLVGRKVKVLLKDVDLIRWKQELIEDRNRLATLHAAAAQVDASRDAKLTALREMIEDKCRNPINSGNRKIIVFTAFADTARYLYDELAPWAKKTLGVDTALVTGTGSNQTTLAGLRKDLASILTTFAPRAKERPEEFASDGDLDLLIATDCISEGQNLQDCDWLINYDIHWNPVRIIQRFGRIDRIGSPNDRIQLVNFWPNMELEEYINLEQRVSGRMVLLDISATGEENLIEQDSGDQMNDLEYRRKQLLKLQDAVIDLEDLSTGVSIADLTLTDFRIDLAQYLKAHPGVLESLALGTCAVTTTTEAEIAPGIIFCLRAEGDAAKRGAEVGYPLGAQYLVHVGDDGTVLLPYTQAKQQGIKVLSLFFIDAVEKYRRYDADGNSVKGDYARIFEEEYRRLAKHPDYQSLFKEVDLATTAAEVHDGYFSIDKKKVGSKTVEVFKDTKGTTQADDETYALIMRNKEKLLSFDTPLKFIFSHSALREGWDNPNVFQICALREMASEQQRRQTIGRGMRLCVNQNGERQRGFEINTLTVIATESYEQFAEKLQKEIEAETGIRFGIVEAHQFAGVGATDADGQPAPLGFDQSKMLWEHLKTAGLVNAQGKVQDALRRALRDGTLTVPEPFGAQLPQVKEILRKLAGRLEIKNADERKQVKSRQAVLQSAEFKALWDRIKHKTTYRVQFDNDALLGTCIKALADAPPIAKTRLQWRKADLAIGRSGVDTKETATSAPVTLDEGDIELPDILTDLQDKTSLTRRSIHHILVGSARLDDFKRNPQQFIELSAAIINRTKRMALVDGIKYQRIGAEEYYAQQLFETEELSGYLKSMIDAQKAVHEQVIYQSDTERTFAEELEKNEAIKVYAKLPGWFCVPTPLGPYNPDWAVLVEKDGAERLYFVVETKSSLFTDDLRDKESAKIECGKAHFRSLAVGENPARYIVARSAKDLLAEVGDG